MQDMQVARDTLADGRAKLQEHLKSNGLELTKLFLDQLDAMRQNPNTKATAELILNEAAKGNNKPAEEAFEIAKAQLSQKLEAKIKEATDRLVLPKTTATSIPPTTEAPNQENIKIEIAGKLIKFHSSNPDGSLNSYSRELRLDEKGNLQMKFVGQESGKIEWKEAFDPTINKKFCCLYVDGNKVYDAAGKIVSSVKWGNTNYTADSVAKYAGKLEEGKVSGLTGDFLKDVSLNGQQVVFTKGLPPSLRTPEVTTPPPVATKPAENPTLPPVIKKQPEINQTPQPTVQPEIVSNVYFSVPDGYGYYKTEGRVMKLDANRNLQMKFIETDGSTSWKEAKDPSTNNKFCCLYSHNGKVYDATGKLVENIQWGNNIVDTSHALKHFTTPEEGKLSCVKDGYFRDMKYNGSQVVLTKGLPPGMTEEQLKVNPTPAPIVNQTYQRTIESIPCENQSTYNQNQPAINNRQYHQDTYQQPERYHEPERRNVFGGRILKIFKN